MMKIQVIIPTYRPGEEFEKTLKMLMQQTILPEKIIVWNTEEKFWEKRLEEQCPRLEVHHISRSDFDHGGTRKRAAEEADAEFLLYMTQDAVPADSMLIERMLRPFQEDERIGAAYARQLPKKDCRYLERMTRAFNYPAASVVRFEHDKERYGIKNYFCSNVCAMYRREVYLSVGGFEERTIFNEDMIFCGKLLQAGYGVAYAADARVYHSHNYSCREQFHRNFDLGVSQAEHPEIFASVSSEKEGKKLVGTTCRRLIRSGKGYLIPEFFAASGCKYAGYFLGKHYRRLPKKLCRQLSLNRAWWK